MNLLTKKYLFLGFLALSLLSTYPRFLFKNPEETQNTLLEETLLVEDLKPSLKEENNFVEFPEKKNSSTQEVINIPSHWVLGLNATQQDYLEGYIPSANDFLKYISGKRHILIPEHDSKRYYDEIINFKSWDTLNYITVNGLLNKIEVFSWDPNDCLVLYNTTDSPLFVCTKWINWINFSPNGKNFVRTNCSVDGMDGYCLFEDYVSTFFIEKTQNEYRCFGDTRSEFCDMEKYLNLIRYDN